MEDRTIAGRYRLTERIGTGGMGVVWRAEDQRLRRVVAVKELLSRIGFDQESIDRAVREGRIAARLSHPNVIALYDVVEHDGHPWLIMEYLPSRSLATVMTERGTLPADEVVRLGTQLANGLAAAHAAGVVHRDVKPGNVLVTEFGTVKVTDFGTSRAADEATVTASGMLVGTPAYLAPEVARGGKGEFPADVFALGATLYAALEGTPPFGVDGNTIALLHRVADGRFPPPRNAGPLEPVLMRLLDPNPETRPTMAEAADMLRGVRFDGAAPPVPPKPAPTAILAAPLDPVPEPEPAPPPAAAKPEPEPAEPAPTPQPAPVQPAPVQPAPVQPAPVQPTPPPQPAPTPTPADVAPRGEEKRGDRKALIALAVVALLAIATVAYLLNRGGEGGSPSAGSGTTTATTAQPTSAAEDPPAQTTTDQAEPTTTTTTTAAVEPTSTQDTTQPPAEIGPDQALSDYYGLLPTNLEPAYARLTDGFKAARARTFADYQGWWGQMSAVSVSNVRAVGPEQVTATVSYTFKGGATQSENHLYTLVKVNGQWMIDGQQNA
ncbi:serine/threonine protein kinase [Saccharothrix saharensis]|uniref:non-specific serine/threonine protein kinase n=1 Tax=Saccharothrix saharensis TaxID=571190 RepID=A0A543J8F3_9PSEU|nr:serine/threonine-protein kinase [Saccharothrix saharensis]TQM79113.1 serine/threonine protein kinase [Saccharothrix saharensis]